MSAEDGSVTLEFGGNEYTFRIAFGQWRELQESVNKPRIEIGQPAIGPRELFESTVRGNCWPDEMREIIRLGLIGGGMKPDRALVLVKRHVEAVPWTRGLAVAGTILARSMFGPQHDTVGKEPTPPEPETATEADPSGALNSTASVLQ
jgi:Phage tail tube protein, GTA-gp10